jgi:hypothetical protein
MTHLKRYLEFLYAIGIKPVIDHNEEGDTFVIVYNDGKRPIVSGNMDFKTILKFDEKGKCFEYGIWE